MGRSKEREGERWNAGGRGEMSGDRQIGRNSTYSFARVDIGAGNRSPRRRRRSTSRWREATRLISIEDQASVFGDGRGKFVRGSSFVRKSLLLGKVDFT